MLVHVQSKVTMRRSREFATSFTEGIKFNGDEVIVTNSHIVREAEGIIAYSSRHNTMFNQYREQGKFTIFGDLGYWGKKRGNSIDLGSHRIIVNSWHPNEYFRQGYPSDRWESFNLEIEDWKENKDGPIIMQGNSAKSCELYGLKLMEWEEETLKEIKKYSDREVIFFPKPDPGVFLEGATEGQDMASILDKAWIVISHHSNVGLYALLKGIPIYNQLGISKNMGITDIRYIEYPQYPEDRKEFFVDVAYTQWSMGELADGSCWKHIKEKVLPLCCG